MILAHGGLTRSGNGHCLTRSNAFSSYFYIIVFSLGRTFVGGVGRDLGDAHFAIMTQKPFPIYSSTAPLPLNFGRVYAGHWTLYGPGIIHPYKIAFHSGLWITKIIRHFPFSSVGAFGYTGTDGFLMELLSIPSSLVCGSWYCIRNTGRIVTLWEKGGTFYPFLMIITWWVSLMGRQRMIKEVVISFYILTRNITTMDGWALNNALTISLNYERYGCYYIGHNN